MPTVNITVTTNWTKLANDTDSGFLASGHGVGHVVYATTATDAPPPAQLEGHLFAQSTPVGRGDLGPGFVWAKVLPPNTESLFVLTR